MSDSCTLKIDGQAPVSVSIDRDGGLPSITMTGVRGHALSSLADKKNEIRYALRDAGMSVPDGRVSIHFGEGCGEFGADACAAAAAQAVAVASGQAEMPRDGFVAAMDMHELDGSCLQALVTDRPLGRGAADLYVDGVAKVSVEVDNREYGWELTISPAMNPISDQSPSKGSISWSRFAISNAMRGAGYDSQNMSISVKLSDEAMELEPKELELAICQGAIIATGQEERPENGFVEKGALGLVNRPEDLGLHSGRAPERMKVAAERVHGFLNDQSVCRFRLDSVEERTRDNSEFGIGGEHIGGNLVIGDSVSHIEFDTQVDGAKVDAATAVMALETYANQGRLDIDPYDGSLGHLADIEYLIDRVDPDMVSDIRMLSHATARDMYDDLSVADAFSDRAEAALPHLSGESLHDTDERDGGESLDEMCAAKCEEAELGNGGFEEARNEMERE